MFEKSRVEKFGMEGLVLGLKVHQSGIKVESKNLTVEKFWGLKVHNWKVWGLKVHNWRVWGLNSPA